MNNFYSTLVQVVATFIGVFLAAITAYFVFLEERNMQFRKEIQQQQLEIRDVLLQLGGIRWPQGLAHYLPPEFRAKYRSDHPDESRVQFLNRASSDLIFRDSELNDLMNEVHKGSGLKGPWEGRFYFWLLDEAVTTITLNEPNIRIAAFPRSPEGFGFEQWRESFDGLRQFFEFQSLFKRDMIEDFRLFISQPDFKGRNLEQHYIDAVNTFFEKRSQVQDKLNIIDKQKILMKGYSFHETVHTTSLVVLITVACVLGIVLPLYFLTLSPERLTPIAAKGFLFGSLIFLATSFIQFGFDVFQRPKFEWRIYASERWYVPMKNLIDLQRRHAENGGVLDLEYLQDSMNSEDQKSFPREVKDAIQEYIRQVRAYNEDLVRFNTSVLQALRASTYLTSLQSNSALRDGQGLTLHPYSFLFEEQTWRKFIDNVRNSKYSYINVELQMPRWSRIEMKMSKHLIVSDVTPLVDSLEIIRRSTKSSEQARQFLDARTRVESRRKWLQEALDSQIHPK